MAEKRQYFMENLDYIRQVKNVISNRFLKRKLLNVSSEVRE